jgi:hypothetical protein
VERLRYWFYEISNQAQTRELFDLTRAHLQLDARYAEVRDELQDMGNFSTLKPPANRTRPSSG